MMKAFSFIPLLIVPLLLVVTSGVTFAFQCKPLLPSSRTTAVWRTTETSTTTARYSWWKSSPAAQQKQKQSSSSPEQQQQVIQSSSDSSSSSSSSLLVKLAASPVGALVILAGVVLFHESGHYLAGRAFGLHAEEFSIGFGPKLLQFQAFGGDDFTVRAILAGGYCSFDEIALHARPWLEQTFILSSGVIFNMLLAFFIYCYQAVYGAGLSQLVLEPGVRVIGLAGQQAAGYGKVLPGDVVVAVNGKPTTTSRNPTVPEAERAITDAIRAVQGTPDGDIIQLSIQRNNRLIQVSVTPKPGQQQKQQLPTIGVFLEPNVVGVKRLQANSIADATGAASGRVWKLTSETASGFVTFFKDLVSGQAASSEYQFRGPLGVIETASSVVATKDWNTVLNYAAAVSINLGVLNAFPIPPLDGFQILMIFAQQVFGGQHQA